MKKNVIIILLCVALAAIIARDIVSDVRTNRTAAAVTGGAK
jgi:hypothetical protein